MQEYSTYRMIGCRVAYTTRRGMFAVSLVRVFANSRVNVVNRIAKKTALISVRWGFAFIRATSFAIIVHHIAVWRHIVH